MLKRTDYALFAALDAVPGDGLVCHEWLISAWQEPQRAS
jgi:hypothetical protein